MPDAQCRGTAGTGRPLGWKEHPLRTSYRPESPGASRQCLEPENSWVQRGSLKARAHSRGTQPVCRDPPPPGASLLLSPVIPCWGSPSAQTTRKLRRSRQAVMPTLGGHPTWPVRPPVKARLQHRLEGNVKVVGKVTPIDWAGAWEREMSHLDQAHSDFENPIPNLGTSRQTSNLRWRAPNTCESGCRCGLR